MKMVKGRPYSMPEWLDTVYPREETQALWRKHGFECVQEAGTALFVPTRMVHGVLNDGENLAVAVTKA